jgi:hypothetical protein
LRGLGLCPGGPLRARKSRRSGGALAGHTTHLAARSRCPRATRPGARVPACPRAHVRAGGAASGAGAQPKDWRYFARLCEADWRVRAGYPIPS